MTQETGLRIRIFGDEVLRKKAKAVEYITQAHRDTLSRMAHLLYEAGGIGLAAPQVGISQALIVVDIGSGLYKLVNPRIVKKEGTFSMEEGCLSVPGVCIKIKRAKRVVIKAKDENSKPVTIEAEGLLACVLQHEIDHLKGKLIVDYASLFDRLKIGGILSKHKRKAENENLPESERKSCQLQL